MHLAIIGWLSFWMVYWVAESLFPFDSRSKDIKTSANVQKTVFRNMVISLPYGVVLWELTPDISSYIPGTYVLHYVIAALIMDGWFYFTHRLLHTKYFYSFHKQHHEFYIPYPLVAVYSSVTEALLCDVTAIGMGPALLKMSGFELEFWMAIMAFHALLIHSSTFHGRDHNLHHGKNIYNFGLLSIFDRIFGTHQ